jgi:hypothetical protein
MDGALRCVNVVVNLLQFFRDLALASRRGGWYANGLDVLGAQFDRLP